MVFGYPFICCVPGCCIPVVVGCCVMLCPRNGYVRVYPSVPGYVRPGWRSTVTASVPVLRVCAGRPRMRVCRSPGVRKRPRRGLDPVGAVVVRVGAAACYSPTSCRVQYHRRARSSLPGSEWVRAFPLGHGRRKSSIVIPRFRVGVCVVGWGPDGGRVCAEGSRYDRRGVSLPSG